MSKITYQEFPNEVRHFIEAYFSNVLPSDLSNLYLVKEDRPTDYSIETKAEFIAPYKIAHFDEVVRWDGVIHEVTHFIQSKVYNQDQIKTSSLLNYFESPLEKEAFRAQHEFQRFALEMLSWSEDRAAFYDGKKFIYKSIIPGERDQEVSVSRVSPNVLKVLYESGYEPGMSVNFFEEMLQNGKFTPLHKSLSWQQSDPKRVEKYIGKIFITAKGSKFITEWPDPANTEYVTPNMDLDRMIGLHYYESGYRPVVSIDVFEEWLGTERIKEVKPTLSWNQSIVKAVDLQSGNIYRYESGGVVSYIYINAVTVTSRIVRVKGVLRHDIQYLLLTLSSEELNEYIIDMHFIPEANFELIRTGVVRRLPVHASYIDQNKTMYHRRINYYAEEQNDGANIFWSSKEGQEKRFEALLSIGDLEDKEVLDVGCGYADFLDYIKSREINLKQYVGIDVVPEIVEKAKELHPGINISERDLIEDPVKEETFDYIFGSGIFALSSDDWNKYVVDMLDKMLLAARVGVGVNFLQGQSNGVISTTPPQVIKLLKISFPTIEIKLKTGYLPDDFTIFLYK